MEEVGLMGQLQMLSEPPGVPASEDEWVHLVRKQRYSRPREWKPGQNGEEGGCSALEVLSVWVGHSM